MQLTCLYHPVYDMIVTDDEEKYKSLIASGMWFDHPNKAKELRIKYEEPIRSESRKGRSNRKRETKTNERDA